MTLNADGDVEILFNHEASTYHVTNVRENSTIPQVPANNWEGLNTFRTNAQIEGGGICDPKPRG